MTIEILSTKETQELDGAKVRNVIRVMWKAGPDDGPFVNTFPAEGFSAAAARQVIEVRAREIDNLRRG